MDPTGSRLALRELVLDASVVLKWLRTKGEGDVEHALNLHAEYERGDLVVTVPPIHELELLNVAARSWHFEAWRLIELAGVIEGFGFSVRRPSLARVAEWAAKGLSSYDASYVALAEERGTTVVTADRRLAAVAGSFASTLEGSATT